MYLDYLKSIQLVGIQLYMTLIPNKLKVYNTIIYNGTFSFIWLGIKWTGENCTLTWVFFVFQTWLTVSISTILHFLNYLSKALGVRLFWSQLDFFKLVDYSLFLSVPYYDYFLNMTSQKENSYAKNSRKNTPTWNSCYFTYYTKNFEHPAE